MIGNKTLLARCFDNEPDLYALQLEQIGMVIPKSADRPNTAGLLTCGQEWFRQNHSDNSRDIVFSDFYKLEADKDNIVLYSNKFGSVHIFRYDAESSYILRRNRKYYFRYQWGGHLSLNVMNTSITLEAWVFLAKCMLEDVYPLTFEGLAIDLIDGTGSKYTNAKFGRHFNFWFDNVQPASKGANLAKGNKVGLIYKEGQL